MFSRLRVLCESDKEAKKRITAALNAYKRQFDLSRQAVEAISGRDALGWVHQPDLDELHSILGSLLEWDKKTIRSKVLPLLIEWNLSHSSIRTIGFLESEGLILSCF